MRELICLILLFLAVYPYFLLLRFLQLGCKFFKHFLNDDVSYVDYED